MRTHAKVTPELRRWIITQTEAGQTPDKLLEAMIKLGWPEGAALEVMERALTEKVAQIRAKETASEAALGLGSSPESGS
jgi:prolyl 4-hydroxylase